MGRIREGHFRYHWNETFQMRGAPIIGKSWTCRRDFIRHDHDFFELQICVSGSAWHDSADGTEKIGRGDIVFLRPGTWHAYRKPRNLSGYICCFHPLIVRRELSWSLSDPAFNRLLWNRAQSEEASSLPLHFRPGAQAFKVICKGASEIVRLGDIDTIRDRPWRLGHLIFLLAELGKSLPSPKDGDRRQDGVVHPSVLQALNLMESEFNEPWGTRSLSARLRINPDYLSRIFRKATGLTPMNYLTRCRSEKAAALLLSSDLPISDIALAVGLPDASHFARKFKAYFSMTAREYRERHQEAA